MDDAAPTTPPVRERLRWWALGIFAMAAIPRVYTAGRYVTSDEVTWLTRSVRFSDALASLELSEATASLGEPATMPGGTTMWIGSVARGLWRLGVGIGWLDGSSFVSADGLAVAQVLASLATAALVAVLFIAVARWAGLVAALTVAVLVGFGPWWVALGAVLHTDELTALFGTIGLVALAHALGVPTRSRLPHRPALVAAGAGVALMASAMTKVTGTGFWVGAAVLVVWALVRDHHAGRGLARPGSTIRASGFAVLAGAAVAPILWPALIADPVFQMERLVAAAGLSTEDPSRWREGSRQFFLGEPMDSPGWAYYPVALALRMTPWFFLATIVGVPAALIWHSSRRYVLVFVAPLTALFVVLSASPKKYDRYGLLLLAQIAVIVGVAVQRALRGRMSVRAASRVVAGVGACAFAISLSVLPWGLAYFNPALGGGQAGRDNLLVGWGEGKVVAAQRIGELEGGDCTGVTVDGLFLEAILGLPCTGFSIDETPHDYVLMYVSALQRDPSARALVEGRELVDTVELRGILYVEIWR